MKIYTRTGDDGKTGLFSGERVTKEDIRIQALGVLDEATSSLGVIKCSIEDSKMEERLEEIQKKLMEVMAQVASGSNSAFQLQEEDIRHIEQWADEYQGMYPEQKSFIIPGDCRKSAMLDWGRTVFRRSERDLISLNAAYPLQSKTLQYMNRISDLLYVMARAVSFKELVQEQLQKVISEKHQVHHISSVPKVVSNAESLPGKEINLRAAKKLIEAVENNAAEMGLPVVIAVANEWGHIQAVHCMDHALPASYDIAVNKAYTAATLRMSTKELWKLSQSGQPLYGINTVNNRIVTFGGGCPIKDQGVLLGGLGVSGGTAEQDIALAEYGVAAYKEM